MQLSKKTLQHLTELKSDDIASKYYVDSTGKIEFDNIFALLDAQVINSSNVIEFFEKLHKECLKKKKSNAYVECCSNLKLLKQLEHYKLYDAVRHIFENTQNSWWVSDICEKDLLRFLFQQPYLSAFEDIVDALKRRNLLYPIVSTSGTISPWILEFIDEQVLEQKNITHLCDRLSSVVEISDFLANIELAKYAFENSIIDSLQSLIERQSYDNVSKTWLLSELFNSSHLGFNQVIREVLQSHDIKFLLDSALSTSNPSVCESMLKNTAFAQALFDNHVFLFSDDMLIRTLKALFMKYQFYFDSYTDPFAYMKHKHPDIEKDIQFTFLLHKLPYQKAQLIELYDSLRSNDIALSKLENIIKNHLESSYNFESLKQYLVKSEKKNLMNI